MIEVTSTISIELTYNSYGIIKKDTYQVSSITTQYYIIHSYTTDTHQ